MEYTPPKTNLDTQNDGLETFQICSIFSIYVQFLGCTYTIPIYPLSLYLEI